MFTLIGAIIIVVELIKSICEPTLPAEYHGNQALERADLLKVQLGEMSKSEFIRNTNRGKYYGKRKSCEEDAQEKLAELKKYNKAFARLYRD